MSLTNDSNFTLSPSSSHFHSTFQSPSSASLPSSYFSDSFFDIIIPFVSLNKSSIRLYLNVFTRLINPYLGFFSNDLSYFHHFPFKAKEMLYRIKSDVYRKNNNNISNIRLSKFEQLSLHYWDALHMQFFCIMALSAKALGMLFWFYPY
jgi:hypothetical protein